MSNFSFSLNVFKSCLLLMRQNEYLWSKGLTHFSIDTHFDTTELELSLSKYLPKGEKSHLQPSLSYFSGL